MFDSYSSDMSDSSCGNYFSTTEEDIVWAISQRFKAMEKSKSEGQEIEKVEPNSSNIKKFQRDIRTQMMASMVPDEVIENVSDYTPKEYTGCLLCGDIFGFTELLDIYNQPGKGGPSRMTKTLNDYIGAMVGEIMAFEGDILKFSGESFLALWKCSDKTSLRYYVQGAINCALVIKENYGKFKTEEGVTLQVKLTITAGPVVFCLIGDYETSYYVCVGTPIDDIKEAEQRCAAGEIMVAPSAWLYVNTSEYLSMETEDGTHYKVLGVGPNWRYGGKGVLKRRVSKQEFVDEIQDDNSDDDVSMAFEIKVYHRTEDFTLRPVILKALEHQEELRKFVIAPVMYALNVEEPLETLIEMRQVVIMFVNVVAKKSSRQVAVNIINQCYKIICNKAKEHKGIVNKVSLFDKDIVFVIIFGLRGLTSVLECREALKCSVKCQHELLLIDEVQSVSIACTTGKSYCGVFGHMLRREYTVMSIHVLKAARMMAAYPDKVTCDRQTFLYSKLEANNFTLMEYKKLRDIKNQGPIYEYTENADESINMSLLPRNQMSYPILGRDTEVEDFVLLLKTFLQNFGIKPCCDHARCTYKNCMVIEGHSKQGKSRLMEEFLSTIEDVPILKITFEKDDHMSSYLGARYMFGTVFKYEKYTLEANRRQRIQKKMQDADKSALCALNNVFDVNFPMTEKYKQSSDEGKRNILDESIRNLCTESFKKPSVISIDNADFMDDESWGLIPAMLETKTVFLVIALNKQRRPIRDINTILKSHHIERMSLRKIGKIYHAGLACQMLGVYAIPADLENVIQSNSNGNPGWIENFLITLLQSKKIFIKTENFHKVHNSGLVSPPLYMMMRLDDEAIKRYKSLIEEKSEEGETECTIDQWEIYIDSCRDKFTDVDVRSGIHECLFKTSEIPICFMTKSFNLAIDVDPEMSNDMKVLELFDSMSYQEQMMLKCASVLGDPFTRRTLIYVWSPESPKAACDVIQRLFEKRVLICARGDFSNGGEYLLLRDKMTDPFKNKHVECFCIGLDIHDTCIFMPKYSSCGFMRFRSQKFRLTTYNLIPDEQKKQLHIKAAKFLQRETRRCISCGCSYFPQNAGCRLDNTPLGRVSFKPKKKKKSLHLQQMGFDELFDYSTHQGLRSTFTSGALMPRATSIAQSWRVSLAKSYASSVVSDDRYGEDQDDARYARSPKVISPFTILKLKNCSSLIRTFSKSDFMSCECHLILCHMYRRLKQHYRGSGQWSEMVVASIHHCKICITNKNYASAMSTINEALDVLKTKDHLINYPKWKITMLFGKFYSLQGMVLMHLDQIDEAHKKFLEAMKTFGFPFPENKRNITFYLKLLKQKWKQKLALYFFPNSFVGENDEISQIYISNSMSETLCYLCRIYISRAEWKLAELAALWSLRNSLQTETSLIRICEAFTNMMIIAQHVKNKFLWLSLEVHALRYCHKKKNYVEAPELRAVAQLYTTIFEARMGRAEYDNALQIGYIVLHISTTSNEMPTIIKLFTLLGVILLEKMFIQEATAIMHELEYFADEIENNSGRTWFYALSVGFHLETGYTFVPFSVVEIFYNGEGINLNNNHYDAKIRLMITMWVWYLRNDRWEAAAIFKKEVDDYRNFKIDSNNHAITTLYLLEGTLLTLVNRIDRRSISGMAETRKEVERLIKKLYRSASFAPFISGRLYHLEAYYAYILADEDKWKKLLKKGQKFCLKYETKLEVLHLDHSEKAWTNDVTPAIRDFWKNHCLSETTIPYKQIEYDNLKLYSYTYPTPLFEN